ncbi:MAG TPA: hypothetical protein VFY69_00385 [Solirubrobacterales bacterium]|nr:hypothetical protein [Solirubrobacterales bacterium]
MKRLLLFAMAVLVLALPGGAFAGTAVPGHTGDRTDADGNGYPDAGVLVTGHYTSLYAYDASGAYHWDLGDGRVYGAASVDDLDQATLSVCKYVNGYRGTFGNDPYLDTGWNSNNIRCYGHDGKATYRYQIVHETDPRYRGNPEWAIWGNWEYHVLTESGAGNLVRPIGHVG